MQGHAKSTTTTPKGKGRPKPRPRKQNSPQGAPGVLAIALNPHEMAQVVAELAQSHGIHEADVSKFASILPSSITAADITPSIVGMAARINREELQKLYAKYGLNSQGKKEASPSWHGGADYVSYSESGHSATRSKVSVSHQRSEKMLKVKASSVLALFAELGLNKAKKWTVESLPDRITNLGEMTEDLEGLENQELLDALVSAIENEDKIKIVDDTAEDEKPAKKAKAKPAVAEEEEEDQTPLAKARKQRTANLEAKRAAKAAKAAKESEVEEEEEEEEPPKPKRGRKPKAKPAEEGEEEAEPQEKAKRGRRVKSSDDEEESPRKKKGPQRVGVIAAIVAMLEKATVKKPVTKEAILESLVEQFPDRDEAAMKVTLNSQLPLRIQRSRGIRITKTQKGGFYIERDEE